VLVEGNEVDFTTNFFNRTLKEVMGPTILLRNGKRILQFNFEQSHPSLLGLEEDQEPISNQEKMRVKIC